MVDVSEVMRRDVVTVGPESTLAAAAKHLRAENSAVAVVVDGGIAVGTVSERDLVQAVVDGADPAVELVRRRMVTPVVSVPPDADLDEVRETMGRFRLEHLPVLEHGRPVGVVSALEQWAPVRAPSAAPGSVSRFRGPYADGPPPEALAVENPPLDRFGLAELRRMVVIGVVLVVSVLRRLLSFRLLRSGAKPVVRAASEGVVDGFEILGPTFVKLGQLIASSPGVFPAPLSESALRCLDEVPPFDGETAREMIRKDLGRPPTQLFKSFEDSPLAAASIGQVHACVLPDGRDAVIKLQRPNIRQTMTTDLRIIYRIARVLQRRTKLGQSANLTGVVEDLHENTFKELNPALEAYRQDLFRTNISAFGDNAHITAPEVFWDYCGPHMICMERMSGVPMDEFDAIRERGIDGELVLRRGVKVWMEAAMIHGPFHGDVHAGNLWVLDDGRATYLDFGLMGELTDDWKQVIKDLFYTSMIDGDFSRIARSFKRVGAFPEDIGTDEEVGMRLEMVFGPMLDIGISQVSLGDVFKGIIQMMESYGVPSPQELMLVTKQLLYFERYAKVHAPDWALARDPFLVKNIFPDEIAAKAAAEGLVFPD